MAVAALGCVVPDVDLAGKSCPCVEGWFCDASTQLCRSSTEPDPEGSGEGSSEGTDGEQTGPVVAFEIVEFSADWSTPESIHWTWQAEGSEAEFHAWELWIATSADAVDDESRATVFDGSINPELGRFTLANTSGISTVDRTITDLLQPSTEYFARLHVLDTAGGRTMSTNVAVRSTTAPPTDTLVIFADELPSPGYPVPAMCLALSDTAPLLGTERHLALDVQCDAAGEAVCAEEAQPAPECWENLRLQDLALTTNGLAGGDFADAFVELHVAIDAPGESPGHGWWSDIGIRRSDKTWTGHNGITLRADGEYRRYQIPLSQLRLDPEQFDGIVDGV
ncbi:MAG: hypothetical protein JKY37_02235, partial [Nannocystaceae bacterium]|nr:hypothetical protein [Nannocystaceae bacterium]